MLEKSPDTILTRPAVKDPEAAIQTVHKLLAESDPVRIRFVRGARMEVDPRLKANDRPTCTEEEIPFLHYPERKNTPLAKEERETLVKENDHGYDAMSYLFHTMTRTPRIEVSGLKH